MATKYCLDTSSFIESWNRNYPPDCFPSFWERLSEAIDQGVIIAPDIVLVELERKDDELFEWASEHGSLFVPLEADLQVAQAAIVNRFPRLTMPVKFRSFADPWVIALAQIEQCPVVSLELPGSEGKPRIPDVCRDLGIGHINVVEFVRTMSWSF